MLVESFNPFGNLLLSSLIAAIPIILFLLCLTVFKMKGIYAAITTLVVTLLIAIPFFKLPVGIASGAVVEGFFQGIFPIGYIVIMAVLLYKITLKSGQFATIQDSIRYYDSVLLSTKFKAPRWLVTPIKNYSVKKHKEISYIYKKDSSKLKNHVVFLGFDFGYRGNSKYLFNYFVKHNPMIESYFITDERTGPHFISTNDENVKNLIETATFVITESYIPDDIHPNGKIIQLWHGTPIKKLFLDSKEPHQNLNIYNYRARKYNKWTQQDYLIVDSEESKTYFESAFPSQKIDILPVGYPRNNYLLNRINDIGLHKRIFSEINIDLTKRVLLYAPTWKTNSSDDDIFPINEQLLKHYNVIYKGHVESKNNLVPEGVIIPPNNIETQDLIIISDIVLTDYSSIIFDALTVDKKGCLYTPNHSQYVEERGVYQDVMDTLKPIWYTDAELLMNDLITDSIPQLNNKYTNKNNQSFEYISKLISNQLK